MRYKWVSMESSKEAFGNYENDCAQAVLQNLVRAVKRIESYIFSGKSFYADEEKTFGHKPKFREDGDSVITSENVMTLRPSLLTNAIQRRVLQPTRDDNREPEDDCIASERNKIQDGIPAAPVDQPSGKNAFIRSKDLRIGVGSSRIHSTPLDQRRRAAARSSNEISTSENTTLCPSISTNVSRRRALQPTRDGEPEDGCIASERNESQDGIWDAPIDKPSRKDLSKAPVYHSVPYHHRWNDFPSQSAQAALRSPASRRTDDGRFPKEGRRPQRAFHQSSMEVSTMPRRINNVIPKTEQDGLTHRNQRNPMKSRRNSTEVTVDHEPEVARKPGKLIKRDHRLFASLNDVSRRDATKGKVVVESSRARAAATDADSKPELVSIKLRKDHEIGNKDHEIVTDRLQLQRMRKKYPKLVEIVPGIGAPDVKIECSQNAANLILKFLFHLNFGALPNGNQVIEALAMAIRWEIGEFRRTMLPHFLQNVLTLDTANAFYKLANHLGDHQLCNAIEEQAKNLTGDFTFTKEAVRFRQKTCLVSCQPYLDPSEFSEYSIPLAPAEAAGPFTDTLYKDINCTITFHSILGTFALTGFQMSFAVDDNPDGLKKIKVDYDLKNLQQDHLTYYDQKEKPLRPTLIFHLKQHFIVRQGQTCKLSVDIEIAPHSCFVLEENTFKHDSQNAKFQLSLESNYKVMKDNKMRFFVEKLFYREVNSDLHLRE